MTDISEKRLANVFGVSIKLLPFIPELLHDLWELGGSSRLITDILRPLNLPINSTRVIDLACGKGAIGMTIARELGFNIVGVDIFRPFIIEAQRQAEEMGVEELCRFKVADVREVVSDVRDFDIAILASAASVFGSLDRCIAGMRRCLKIGGYMVIDSGFLKKGEGGYGMYVSHDNSLRQLQRHGDKLINEVLRTDDDIEEICEKYLNALRRQVDLITKAEPKISKELSRYIKTQEEISEAMVKRTSGAVWLLQKLN